VPCGKRANCFIPLKIRSQCICSVSLEQNPPLSSKLLSDFNKNQSYQLLKKWQRNHAPGAYSVAHLSPDFLFLTMDILFWFLVLTNTRLFKSYVLRGKNIIKNVNTSLNLFITFPLQPISNPEMARNRPKLELQSKFHKSIISLNQTHSQFWPKPYKKNVILPKLSLTCKVAHKPTETS